MADLGSKRANLRLARAERPDLKPGRPGSGPGRLERPDLHPERPDMRPERAKAASSQGGGTDGRKDGHMGIHPCVLQDIGPLGPLPKKE